MFLYEKEFGMTIGITEIGAVFNVLGSVMFAIRVKMLLKWICLVLEAHEMSITALMQLLNRPQNTVPIVSGMNVHLNNVIKNEGQWLLVLGFFFIFIGVILQVTGVLITVTGNIGTH